MGPPHSQPYMTGSKKKTTLSITCINMRIKTQFWCKNVTYIPVYGKIGENYRYLYSLNIKNCTCPEILERN